MLYSNESPNTHLFGASQINKDYIGNKKGKQFLIKIKNKEFLKETITGFL